MRSLQGPRSSGLLPQLVLSARCPGVTAICTQRLMELCFSLCVWPWGLNPEGLYHELHCTF